MNRVDNYANAYAEVYTILQYLDEEERSKIPPEVMEAIEQSRNEEYVFDIEEDIDLREQVLLTETRAILFNLFRDYLSTPSQKQKIIEMQKEERERVEEEKRKKYNPDKLFENNANTSNKSISDDSKNMTTGGAWFNNCEETALVKVEKENIFTRIVKKIKSFFIH